MVWLMMSLRLLRRRAQAELSKETANVAVWELACPAWPTSPVGLARLLRPLARIVPDIIVQMGFRIDDMGRRYLCEMLVRRQWSQQAIQPRPRGIGLAWSGLY